jgi:osmotically-inducible protein OsmY
LRQSPIPALRQLCVEESETEIVISGCVSSYYLKQLAQETVMAVRGRRELVNRVTVVRP